MSSICSYSYKIHFIEENYFSIQKSKKEEKALNSIIILFYPYKTKLLFIPMLY